MRGVCICWRVTPNRLPYWIQYCVEHQPTDLPRNEYPERRIENRLAAAGHQDRTEFVTVLPTEEAKDPDGYLILVRLQKAAVHDNRNDRPPFGRRRLE